MSFLKFTQKISIINANPYVTPPKIVLSAIFKQVGKDKGPIPIKGKINDEPFIQTLVKYNAEWRLYVNMVMAKSGKLEFKKSISEITGRKVDMEIEYNPTPPIFAMDPLLKNALDTNSRAKNNWQKLIPSRRKEILRYFSWLKSSDAKERNLKKVIEVLSGKEGRFMARSWKDGK